MTKYDDTLRFPGCTTTYLMEDIADIWTLGVTAETGDNADARSLLIAVREALPDGDALLTVWDAEDGIPVLLVGPKWK